MLGRWGDLAAENSVVSFVMLYALAVFSNERRAVVR